MDLVISVPVKDLLCLCYILFGLYGVFSKDDPITRFDDRPFMRLNPIINRNVTCANSTWGRFPDMTYTCDDIKVDGLRLAYGYYPGWGVDDLCQETGGKHEFQQLCFLLLKTINQDEKGVHAVYVNNASCSYIDEERFLLKKTQRSKFVWTKMKPGRGWVSSLSCMLKS